MIQYTFDLSSTDEIEAVAGQIREKPVAVSASGKVLLAWARFFDEDDFSGFKQKVLECFPDFTIIGANCHSKDEILNISLDGSGKERGCLLTFLFFEKAGAALYGIESGYREEAREGRELRDLITGTKNPRGVFLVPPDYYNSTEDVLRELKDLKNVPVFGIKTSLHAGYRSFGYEPGRKINDGSLLALIFHGESLNIRVHYNLGWTPVGKVMSVTGEENPFFVDEIDGKKAAFVYNKYLGLRNDQIIPQNLSEFPLIIDRDGVKISRIGITGPKEGQLIFGAPVYLNDKISLSYGNPDDLFTEIREDVSEIASFEPQACLLIVCANRVMLLKERESEEIGLYEKHIKEAASVYGYGEMFYLDGRGGELNSALVSVVFRETGSDPAGGYAANGEDMADIGETGSGMAPPDDLIVPFPDRLSRMFKEMSADLLMAVKDAEDANRAKSVFYSTVSHEIRTPLNSILGMNEMILKECGDETIVRYADNIKSSGRILLQLVNDILDTGKLEAGKMEIIPVDYNVRETMDELAGMISYSAKEKGLEFCYFTDEKLPAMLRGDKKRISQCILNLLSNAVKYTDSGRVVFNVSSHPADENHVKLTVSVRDSGIGIKPEDIDKLSIPFERVDGSRNYKVEGTGLGLNIVNNLLSLMDSRLVIKSVYGKGSDFSFTLVQEVIRSADQKGDEKQQGTAPEKTWGDLEAGNASILVVDDTEMNLQLVRLFLKNSKIGLDTAANGPQAIDMTKKKKYDIIFLDRKMPGLDGLETFKKIREDSGNMNAKSVFILLTADEGDGIRENALREGFSDFLAKPFKPQMLENIIKKHLP